MNSPAYVPIEPTKWTIDKAGGRLRWLNVVGMEKTLQQEWTVEEYMGGSLCGVRYEWRDVPTES